MYYKNPVPIPSLPGKISIKSNRGIRYVHYVIGREYLPDKKYTGNRSVPIGKVCKSDSSKMYPNDNYFTFFPDSEYSTTSFHYERSRALHIGSLIVIRKLMKDTGIQSILENILGTEDAGLFMDLAAYSIITENNAAQYYPDYAYDHILFTEKMKIYSDTKVGEFLKELTLDDKIQFFQIWNETKCKDNVYISYDSTNKACQAGDVDIVEVGHSKRDLEEPIYSYAIAYDTNNSEPLLYELYGGSIVDISQLEWMVKKVKAFGYQLVEFILDRGYFSKGNINLILSSGYNFIMMVKGKKPLVRSLVESVYHTFEDKSRYYISEYGVYGTTVKRKLFDNDPDGSERYFHIYYNASKSAGERAELESKIDVMENTLKRHQFSKYKMPSNYEKYFDAITDPNDDTYFTVATRKYAEIDDELQKCGYFVIVTSREMTAKEALLLYKGRDSSEKLFRADKSFLGNDCGRVYTDRALESKMFIAFIALIIRDQIYKQLKDEMKRIGKRYNHMTVPAAIRELEKIILIQINGTYMLDHSITKKQKMILNAFGLDASKTKDSISDITNELLALNKAD